ncbi:chorismate mutase [Sodalis sp. RH23]|uniref:chorismate mutase n=1 Tax=unclassified Sodalis (in: enterobacteria) TaxID=2636512 RepID=UPI0039B576C6
MHHIVLLLSSFFMAGAVFASSVSTVTVPHLSSAINQRLLVMKDVAGYKAEHHLPVEDLARERKVVASAQEDALAQGLDPQSVLPFIQAQMDVAKAIQYRYLADWLSSPEPSWQPRSLDEVRGAIADQDKVILNSIGQRLLAGGFSEADKAEMYNLLHAPHLSDADRHRLVDALVKIKRRL